VRKTYFHVKFDEDIRQTVISGMGELHLDVLVNRLLTEYHLKVNVGRPQVVYRETVEKEIEASARFAKETEEVRHFGEVFLRISPMPGETESNSIQKPPGPI